MSGEAMTSAVRRLIAVFVLVLLPGLAHAQCVASATDLDFGQVNLITTPQPTGTGTITVTCTNSSTLALTYRVCVNLGAGTGASGATRRMLNGSNALSYQLYQNASRTTPWGSRLQSGNGNPATVDLLTLPGVPSTQTLTVYGQISASQSGAAGGQYASSYAGADATYNYQQFPVTADCSTLSNNPSSTSFSVRANVNRTCAVSATLIDFGSRTTLSSALNAQGNLSVTCTNALPFSIALGNGLWGSAPAARRMRLLGTTTGPTIIYGLYQDAARTLIWGGSAGQTFGSTGSGVAQVIPVYARLQPQVTPQTGTYTDTVVVTVTY